MLGASLGTAERIRVLSVDDHALLREGIAGILTYQQDMVLVCQASGGWEAVQRYREQRPDVTLMDLQMPDLGGIDALVAIRAEFPDGVTEERGDMVDRFRLMIDAPKWLASKLGPKKYGDVDLR